MAIELAKYFGDRTGTLKIYLGFFSVGWGTFTTFTDTQMTFSGSYDAFGQSGTFTLSIQLPNQPTPSGTCELTLNTKSDNAAQYQTAGNVLMLVTTLNPTPIKIYPNHGGTQVDGVSGHNFWIGEQA
jgi:hypothetical protein